MHPSPFRIAVLTFGLAVSGISRAAAEALPLAGSVTTTASAGDLLWEPMKAVGAYDQPVWVKNRRFANTRVHIQRDPWEVAVEQWARGRLIEGDWFWRMQEEIEIGLPGRIQLDFYVDWTYDEVNKSEFLDYAAEIRYGLADWGKIWGNPALYFEYKWTDGDRGGDVIEPKILFGGDFGGSWQWGVNFVYEREISGPEEAEEFQITGGLSKVLGNRWSVGLEAKAISETVEGARSRPEYKFLIGPSIQWRPTDHAHIDFVSLFGCTEESPDVELWFVGGINFGGSGRNAEAPVSGRR